MEEDIIEVTKTSISIKGKWVRQTLGKEPDFTSLKFSVKCSDDSTLKYSNWEEFKEAGGDYFTEVGKVWSSSEGTQSITFYLTDVPSVTLIKSLKINKSPIDIESISSKRIFRSGDSILSSNFNLKIRFDDKSVEIPKESDISIEPNIIPKDFSGKFKCIFIYTYDEVSISKEYNIDVKKKLFSIKNKSSDFGNTKFIIGGKEIKEVNYSTSLEWPIRIKIRAVANDKHHNFMRWVLSSDELNLESSTSQETVLEIPIGFGEDIWVKSIWDNRVSDQYGNIFNIENNTLTTVELHSDKVEIPATITSIAAKVFNDADIKELFLPNTLQTIGIGAFSGCVNLTHIDIPSSVTLIDNSAFTGCSALESVKFNQAKSFTLGSRCFKDCSSLCELDFLALKDNFKNCIFGDGENTDVWEGCKIRIVKLTKGNFFKDTKGFSTSNPFTIRTPGSFKVHVSSKTDTVRARVIGTTADGSASGISQDLTKTNAYCKVFDRKNNEDTFIFNSYDYKQDYDLRESCGCYVIGEGNTDFDIEMTGLGNPEFNYPVYVEVYSNYRFTSNGSSIGSWVHEGNIGEGFSNWNMMDYVNGLLYPNITTEDGIRLIDLMLPIYNRRQF